MSTRPILRYAGGLAAVLGLAACGSATTATPSPTASRTGGQATAAATAPALTESPTPAPAFAAAPAPVPPAVMAAPAPAVPASLQIVQAPIPYPDSRKQEMAAYSLRHSGSSSWQLAPSVIVLHFTAGSTWQSARNAFASDAVSMGEEPGTCSHFLVDKDGTVYQLVPTSVRCRHAIGLGDVAIGIEMVQEAGLSSAWADQQILDRPAQVGAALALVRQLQAQFGIATTNVIGHAMANSAPQFHDLEGWHNDHTDWQAADVAVFRSLL